jgi:hypothetical protein
VIRTRYLIAGILVGIVISAAGLGKAGDPRLFGPLVHMQRVMGMRVAHHAPALHWFQQVRHGYLNPPHKKAWACIHRFEGSWRDTGAPFWGGLQFDSRFQQTYNPYLLRAKGTADHWSPLEQMWTAERAFRSGRGFYPWPKTARYCGLLL